MTKELVISADRHETKVAILEDDQLVEIYFQRANEYSLAGSIHKGRVTRVLPGMQSAFVNLGLERDTFLYVTDFFEENEDIDAVEDRPERGERENNREGNGGGTRRFDRQQRSAEAPPPGEVEAAPEMDAPVAEEIAAAPVVRSSEFVPAPPPRTESGEQHNGNRDRDQGRRSRRRRNRGRGFPDSKYASESSITPERPLVENTVESAAENAAELASAPAAGRDEPSISDLLKEGQEIIVQIAKEPLGRRARASLRTSRCPAASWSTCRPSITSACRARSRATKSACA
jgi:Rne/Rng family ribonuclease